MISCGSAHNQIKSGQLNSKDIKDMATQYLGNVHDIVPNTDHSLFICINKNEDPRIKFMVISEMGKIIKEKQVILGSVKWHDTHSLKITEMPRVIKDKSSKPEDFVQIVHLKVSDQ